MALLSLFLSDHWCDSPAPCISVVCAHCTGDLLCQGLVSGELSSTRHTGSLPFVSPTSACGWWVVACGGRRLCPFASGGEPLPGLTWLNQDGCLSPVVSKSVAWRCGRALTAAVTVLIAFPEQYDAHRVRPRQVLPPLREHRSGHILCSSWAPGGPHISSLWASTLTSSFWLEPAQKI